MRNLRNLFAAFALAAVLTFSATAANAGIIVAGLTTNTDPCTERSTVSTLTNQLRGIIVAGFTGIIVAGYTDNTKSCGIIVAG